MNVFADHRQRVVIQTGDGDWFPSPVPGVERMYLERNGGEIARATSLVRYAPGAAWPAHSHGAGEELFVLDGELHDEHGRYPAGTYVRNPPGSSHVPHSPDGCLLFVKLRYFAPGDTRRIVVNTARQAWLSGLVAGLSVMPLHEFQTEGTSLVNWDPGTVFRRHVHPGGEEIFVLTGTFEDDRGSYPAGTWLRNPPWSAHSPFSRRGCRILVKVGHLDPSQPGEPPGLFYA